jgi:mannan endo-1,4-beta-mannosidase
VRYFHSLRPTVSATSLILLLVVAFVLPASASATIRLGAFNPGGPSNLSSATALATTIGRQPEIAMWYHDFGNSILTSEEKSALLATGQTPMVTWEPNGQSLSDIAAGKYDAYVRSSAKLAKAWGGELMLRFAHEMNGSWYSWSGSPTTYVSAWQHLVSIFREEGVTNVRWVWAPNVDRSGTMPFSSYFPGDDWVDYVGLDGYNFGAIDGSWFSLEELFSSSYAKVTALSTKPVIITETGSSELGGSKADWIREGFIKTIPQRFPRVAGVIWFNKEQDGVDWRIETSVSSQEAFREVANCTIYGGTVPCDSTAPAPAPVEEAPPEVVVTVPPKVKGKGGKKRQTRVTYKLSQKAKVKVRLQIRKKNGYARRGSLVRSSGAGRTRLPLRRLIGRHDLPVGKYRVTVVAHGKNGHTSHPRRAFFRVV